MLYSNKEREQVKHSYLSQIPVPVIANETGIAKRTIYHWIKLYDWDELPQYENVEQVLDKLIIKKLKSKNLSLDAVEMIERLQAAKEREIKMQQLREKSLNNERRQNKKSNTGEQDNKEHSGSTGTKKNKSRKTLALLSESEILSAFKEDLFQYQLDLWDSHNHRTRHILKSRQIGLTWYFAREAVTNALLTGENQIFLSASKNQSAIFNGYIKDFVKEKFGVDLKGTEKVKVPTAKGEAVLSFLSTNSSTAQGYSGHLYVDECFWINNFKKLKKVASAIASHKQWRKTFFSTPSTKTHEAYSLWSGSDYNEVARARGLVELVLPDNKVLSKGWVGPDTEYRKIITIHDALDGGCTLFDLDRLQIEYTPDDFAQLFECQFIDDSLSVFSLNQLLACATEDTRWMDYKPNAPRPFGNKPVWVGYDPSRYRDSAVISIVAPPSSPGGKYRVLEVITMHDTPWSDQADQIKKITERYNVEHISIDRTGPGLGVYEAVKEFYPSVQGLHYNPEIKSRLVLKAQDVIINKRLVWGAEHSTIPQSFLMIKKIVTGHGISYQTSRDNKNGHADAAWSIMHALFKNGLKTDNAPKPKVVFSKEYS